MVCIAYIDKMDKCLEIRFGNPLLNQI